MVAGDFFTSSACGPTNLIEPSVYYGSVDGILMNLQTWGHGSWWVHLRSLDHYHYLLWWHDRAASGPWNRGFSTSIHYGDVIRSAMASQMTDISIVYSTSCSGADRRNQQSFTSLAFVRGIHRWPMNSLHRGPVTRKTFLFDDVIMSPLSWYLCCLSQWF